MNLNERSKIITLDWDNITPYQARLWCAVIYRRFSVVSVALFQSPTKGFHCIVTFAFDVNVLRARRMFKDDGNRIINDIFNRPPHIHDVLWTSKTKYNVRWYAIHLFTWDKTKSHARRRDRKQPLQHPNDNHPSNSRLHNRNETPEPQVQKEI